MILEITINSIAQTYWVFYIYYLAGPTFLSGLYTLYNEPLFLLPWFSELFLAVHPQEAIKQIASFVAHF